MEAPSCQAEQSHIVPPVTRSPFRSRIEYRADAAYRDDDKDYTAGTFVLPMKQVFARYAKDLLETQTYPEVRRAPNAPPEAPYDVTTWSLGLMLGVDVVFAKKPLPDGLALTSVPPSPKRGGEVLGAGTVFSFDYTGPEGAIAITGCSRRARRSTCRAA